MTNLTKYTKQQVSEFYVRGNDIAEVQSTLYFNADGELCGYFSTQDEAKK